MLFEILKKYVKETDTEDQYAQLARNIEKKVLKGAVTTAIDALSIIVTTIVASKVIDNINEDYGKKAFSAAAAIIFGYQVNKTIREAKDTQSMMKSYSAATEMIGTDIPLNPYPDMQPTNIIDLADYEYHVEEKEEEKKHGIYAVDSEEFIDEDDGKNHSFEEPNYRNDDSYCPDEDDEGIEDDYNFVVHIGDPIEEQYVDPNLR